MSVGMSLDSIELLNFKRQRRLAMMLIILLSSLYLTNFLFVLSTFVGINYDLMSKIVKAIPVVATIVILPVFCCMRYRKTFIATIAVLLLLYACSGIIVTNSYYKEYLRYFIAVCLPCMITAYAIEDYRHFLMGLKYVAVIFAVLSLIMLLIKQNSADTDADYFMSYSYSSSIFAMALFNDVKVQKGWDIPILISKIIFITSITLLGARGPLLAIFLFIVSKNISSPQKTTVYKIAFLAVVGIFLLTYNQIFSVLNKWFLSQGIKSRTLSSLSGTEVSMSGRENYYSFYLDAILSNPVQFRGIASDWDHMGYPHQIFIELTYQLGIIGLVASLIIVGAIIYVLLIKKYNDPFLQTCDIFFLAIGVYTLLLSDSLWKSLQFWIWLGYMFNPQRGGMQHAASRNQLLQLRQHRYDHASNC